MCTDEPSCARGDWDKSAFLEISEVAASEFQWIDKPTKAQVTFAYQLSGAAAACDLDIYNDDLEEVTVIQPVGGELDPAAGFHQCTVVFEDPDQIVGVYSFVVSALETQGDAEANRDGLQKPALQNGCADTYRPVITAMHTIGSPESPYFAMAASHAVDSQDQYPHEPKYETYHCPSIKDSAMEALEESAVFVFYGHASPAGDRVTIDSSIPGEPAEKYIALADIEAADLDPLLVVVWCGCGTAAPNQGWDMTTESVVDMEGTGQPRADAAVGWEESISTAAMVRFSDIFWDRFAGAQQDNVDDATYNACWDAWVWTGDDGILSYRVEGDYSVTLAPTRWSD